MRKLKNIKTNLFIAILLVFGLVFVNGFTNPAMASSDIDVKVEIPEIPDVEILKVDIPKVEIPEKPKVKIPEKPKVNANTNTNNNKNSKKTNKNKKPELTVNSNGAEIEFVLSKSISDIKAEYDSEVFFVQIENINNETIINIFDMDKEKEDKEKIKIYLPNQNWGEVEFNTQDSSFDAKKIFKSAKIVLNMSDSNADIELPKDFKGSIDMNISDTDIEIKSVDKFKDAVFVINSLGKISLPKTVKKTKDGIYIPKSKKTLPITINADKNSVVGFK